MAVNPAAMRYAGPREAISRALIRKNCGCTHGLGCDRTGLGNGCGTYDAQPIYGQVKTGELGITPMKFEHAVRRTRTGAMATGKTSPSSEERIHLSETKVCGLPPEFSRPEPVAELFRAMQAQS